MTGQKYSAGAELLQASGLTKKDIKCVLGCLLNLRNIFLDRSVDASSGLDYVETDYYKWSAEIMFLYDKIEKVLEQFEEEASCDGKE